MKKKLSLLVMLITMAASVLGGCGKEDSKLTVYVVQEDPLFDTAIVDYARDYPKAELDVVYFDTYEDVNERLQTEVMSGGGPDVLLFNTLNSDVDPYKVALSGSLMELDEQVAELSDEEYFSEILDAGKFNGHQYYLPLSWNALQVYTSQETMETKEYDSNWYHTLPAEAEALKGENDMALSNFMLVRPDVVSLCMEAAGVKIFDEKTGELLEQKEEVKQAVDFAKMIYDNYGQTQVITSKYSTVASGQASHIAFWVENRSLMTQMRYMEGIYQKYTDSEMYFAPLQRLDERGITAQVVQYGAINANSDKAEEAWELLKYILDVLPSVYYSAKDVKTAYYVSLNVASYEECIRQLTIAKGPNGNRLSDTGAQLLRDVAEQVNEAVIPNITYASIVHECMRGYLNGTDSFDICYDTLVQRTKLYLGE